LFGNGVKSPVNSGESAYTYHVTGDNYYVTQDNFIGNNNIMVK